MLARAALSMPCLLGECAQASVPSLPAEVADFAALGAGGRQVLALALDVIEPATGVAHVPLRALAGDVSALHASQIRASSVPCEPTHLLVRWFPARAT